jgi:hypothetical protein
MDLRRGARAAVPILDGFVDVAHVYTWEVAVLRSDQPVAAADLSPLRISAERVWHQLELVNDTGSPWTTGPALLLQDGKPLAQELLTYTPRGASVRVPVTVAVDVRGAYGSEETGRTPGALKWAGYSYMRIDEKGTLTVTNHKPEAVTVEVSCRIGGKIDEAGEGAEIVIQPFRSEDWSNYRGHPAANNSSLLRWRRTIAPGTQETLDLQSHHFVRE